MWDFISDNRSAILFDGYQHASLVIQAVFVSGIIALLIAILVTRVPALEGVANAVSAIGLTIPSFALIGLLIPLTGIGTTTAFIAIAFYAALPILRNAIVGLRGVDATLLESARGMGMSELSSLVRIRIPLAWPVILAGVRISVQMSMGIAAIAAYVLGPGMGKYIFKGLVTIGGANSVENALVGTLGIVVIAEMVDVLLVLLGRFTVSKGIRVA